MRGPPTERGAALKPHAGNHSSSLGAYGEGLLPQNREPRVEEMNGFQRLLRDRKGATMIEYCLIAAMIALAMIAALKGLGTSVGTTFTNVSTGMN